MAEGEVGPDADPNSSDDPGEMGRDPRLRELFEVAPIAIGIVELAGRRTVVANEAMRQLLGYDDDELADRDWARFSHPDDVEATAARFEQMAAGTEDRFDLVRRFVHRDGRIVWGRTMVRVLQIDAGRPTLAVCMVEDISAQHELEEQLREAEATYRLLVEESPAVVYVARLDLSRPWSYMSPGLDRLLGFTADEWLAGPHLWWKLMSGVDRPRIERELEEAALSAVRTGGGAPHVLHYRMRHRDGGERWIRDEFRVLEDRHGEWVYRGVLIDVTREKTLEADLEHQALHDPLTELANRHLFADRVAHAMARTRHGPAPDDALILLDLDDFKTVNDSLGHAAGDELIRSVAHRIQACLRPSDTAGRLGGDEFALLLEELHDPVEAIAIAERVCEQIGREHPLADKTVTTSASAGVTYLHDATSAEEALRNADLAMYRAKALGKGRVATYELSLHTSAVRRLDIRSALDAAIDRGELAVHLQPVVELTTMRVVAAEALLRWTHPVFGAVPPDDFVPIAEETGAIHPIGQWVLRASTRWLAAQHAAGHRRLTVSINLSPVQLEPGRFAAVVEEVLDETGLPPRAVVFEITEQALMADRSWHELEALHRLGVRIAVDDFGTGYASLAYLSRLTVDVLKIDRSFVQQLGAGERGRAVPRAIVQLASSLALEVVAEGIETADQLDELRDLGCRLGQGYLFAAPAAADRASELLGRTLGVPLAP